MSWNEQIRQRHTLQLHANSSLQISFAQRAYIHHASNSEQLKQFHQLKHGMIGQECLAFHRRLMYNLCCEMMKVMMSGCLPAASELSNHTIHQIVNKQMKHVCDCSYFTFGM